MLSKESKYSNKIKNAVWAAGSALALMTHSVHAIDFKHSIQQNLVELSSQDPDAVIMKNIDYLASAYNIYFANPMSDGVDPGFSSAQVFDLDYTKKKVSDDKRFQLPDGVDIKSENKCSLSFITSSMSSESDIKQNF
jgi:hypothetical protein